MNALLEPYRFDAASYYRMGETGVIPPDQRVELLDGQICAMSPIGSPHARAVGYLHNHFVQRLAPRALVRSQSPLDVDALNQPEPDIMLLRPRDDEYGTAHPKPTDVLLVIEVADSSLERDREVKAPLYGGAGVAEYWLVDLSGARVLVYRQTEEGSANGYGEPVEYKKGTLAPLAFPNGVVKLAELFG